MKNNKEKMVIVKTNPKDGTACPLLDISNEMAPVCALDNSVPYCKECRKGFSRAEAVERMAKALCQLSKKTEDCNLCSICWEEGCNLCDFDAFAEAALDALLGKETENAK